MSIDKIGRDLQCTCDGKKDVFIETGTAYGDGIQSAIESGMFDRYISIELNPDLADHSKKRFADNDKVEVLCGSSESLLPEVIRSIEGSSFFLLLDAHFSGGEYIGEKMDTYLFKELECLTPCSDALSKNIVMIDDIQFFEEGYIAFNASAIPAGESRYMDPVSGWCVRIKEKLSELTGNPVGYYRGTVSDSGTPIGPLFFISKPNEGIS